MRDSTLGRGSTQLAPVALQERITVLDVLRGVAIFGILLANILIFASPATSAPLATGGGAPADQLVGLFQGLFVEGKFYTLFSILFGMGLALQSQRAGDLDRAFATVYVRRMIVLLFIGLVHGVLFFAADILAFYAIIALIAVLFRRAGPRTLLATAISIYAVGLLVIGAYAVAHRGSPVPTEPDWQQLAESRRLSAQNLVDSGVQPADTNRMELPAPAFVPHLTTLLSISELQFYEFMSDEQRVFQRGRWTEMVWHRAARFFIVDMPLKLIFTSWRVLALFVLGIYFVRRSFLIDASHDRGKYKRLAISLFALGMILEVVGAGAQLSIGASLLLLPVFLVGIFGGIVALSLSYAAAVALVCARTTRSIVVDAVGAVGRTALTNYLLQSVICGFIFYSYGFGLFGQVGSFEAVVIALPIFACQLVLSSVWLRFFRFGPVEWLWRTLSYMRFQPMRRGGKTVGR